MRGLRPVLPRGGHFAQRGVTAGIYHAASITESLKVIADYKG
jgi:hypothetical protein